MMGKKKMVKGLSEGSGLDDLFLVEECDLRRARNGSLYLHMILADRTGKVNARKWDARPEDTEGISPGDILRVRGFVESYRGRPQVIIRQLKPSAEGEAELRDFLPSSPWDPSKMLADLKEQLDAVKNPHLRALFDAFFDDEGFCRKFKEVPAATRLHHAHLGGLLEHTLSLTRSVMAVADRYPSLDRDILLAGAFLHDIGKTEELALDRGFAYTDRGKLLGHITLGSRLLAEKAASVGGFPRGLLDLLTHLILSHHGKLEFGSPKLPMTAEAVALHLLDDLDAKLIAVESLKKGESKGSWTEYVRSFERAFYLGGAAEVDES